MNKIIIANHKMNLTLDEINNFIRKMISYDKGNLNIILCPATIYLERLINTQPHPVCCQNISEHKEGSYTGEVSCQQVKSIGCQYVLVGHSEQRKYFFEDNHKVNKKLKQCLKHKLKPVLCIGESKKEKSEGRTVELLKQQLDEALLNLPKQKMEGIIIAYEPVWAIGTGNVPLYDEIRKNITFIKKYIDEIYRQELKVLYGGSVDQNNIKEIIDIKEVDGVLIGGGSTKIETFINIMEKIK